MSNFKQALKYGFLSVGVSLIIFILVSFLLNDPELYTKFGRLFFVILFIAAFLAKYVRESLRK